MVKNVCLLKETTKVFEHDLDSIAFLSLWFFQEEAGVFLGSPAQLLELFIPV